MSIYDYEQAFGAWDLTTEPMRRAISLWRELYYEQQGDDSSDPCQRIGYTVVNKLVKTIFGEYAASCSDSAAACVVACLNPLRKEAMQQTLVGGECYIKPCIGPEKFSFTLIPRTNLLIFNKDAMGNPTDVGLVEKSILGKYYYTLLERRTVDEQGFLTIQNRLFRSLNAQSIGTQVKLREHSKYENLQETYRYTKPMGSTGLVRLRTPMLNCVDGSSDGVAVYAAAAGLIKNIDRNEAQLNGEFSRGESRVITSADMLNDNRLADHLFVGLDEDPERVGLTIFSPTLREQSFLARKNEYLRNVESVIGLKRGMLSDANATEWTATEIASSAGDYNLTIIDFQGVWDDALRQTVSLCAKLAEIYRLPKIRDTDVAVDWGNGILYDEDKTWEDYKDLVGRGLLKPEIALGWRFNMPANTDGQRLMIRQRLMPETQINPVE